MGPETFSDCSRAFSLFCTALGIIFAERSAFLVMVTLYMVKYNQFLIISQQG